MKVINVQEFHKKEEDKNDDQENKLFNKWWFWCLAGMGLSLILIVMGLFDHQIFIVVPAGPISGIAAWFIKNKMKKFFDYDKDLFR